jgi:UDP-2,3-diacylglucosamine hydrolase
VDGPATLAWLQAADAQALIHGHTHKPADHRMGGRSRAVLSDWDAAAAPPRLEALRLTAEGARRIPLA